MGGSVEKPLEVLLMEKNKRLTTDNTSIRNECDEHKRNLEDVRGRLKDCERTIGDQKGLITRLEQDLLQRKQRGCRYFCSK